MSLSAFSLLFSEIVQYCQNRTNQINDLEKRFISLDFLHRTITILTLLNFDSCYLSRLSDIGCGVGSRVLELVSFREKSFKRETRLVSMLSFIQGTVWKSLFGKQADSLEKSVDHDNECRSFIIIHPIFITFL